MSLNPHMKMERDSLKQVKNANEVLSKTHNGVFNTTAKNNNSSSLSATMFDRQLADEKVDAKKEAFSKSKRDDRQTSERLDIYSEEKSRTVPVRSSGVYGARAPIDTLHLNNSRKKVVQAQFYSKEIGSLSHN
eukprot:m.6791 g.6791  ORF g.6791 m.6791 type:complete len:133 (-) comp5540_c0_seq2:134-532(-)